MRSQARPHDHTHGDHDHHHGEQDHLHPHDGHDHLHSHDDHDHLHPHDGHDHVHPHPHPPVHPPVEHPASPVGEEASGERTIHLETKVLAKNDALAEENRRWLAQRNIQAINLISSPGAGKTLLLERTLERLHERLPCAVIVGDLQTDNDARRLQGKGAVVHQIETVHSCHLDAGQVGRLLPQVLPAGSKTRLLIIENVGNLVCPAAFDLGEQMKIALLSVTEGEDKPLKYPTLFHHAPVVLITKVDLVPYLAWDRERCWSNIRQVRPDAQIFEVSAVSGAGMDAWIRFLEQMGQ
ncbi:MAG: hydrogenase nickel incorporation protein HypB [Magnetococcales bacterium]|nr:hydrogenase nickel incorporation protein HypB [Magnetococcales bacterium]